MNPWYDTVAIVAVQQPSTTNDKGGQGEDFGKSSPVGLVLLILFFVAVFFLVKSMNKHLKRVPASFDEPAETSAAADAQSDAQAEPKKKD